MQQVFVFVVCGGQEHIDTLNFSLQYLRHFSKKAIWVVTDSRRNEGEIQHTDIIDIETPKEMDNHQASIYLKTGLHKFLPQGNLYCYLDTDIMALDEQVDEIFNEYVPPITFAPDHCVMKYFGVSAVMCNCTSYYKGLLDQIDVIMKKYDPNYGLMPDTKIQDDIQQKQQSVKANRFSALWHYLKYQLSGNRYQLGQYSYHKDKKYWTNNEGEIVLYNHQVDYEQIYSVIKEDLNLILDKEKGLWQLDDGRYLLDYCEHFQEQLSKDFHVGGIPQDWQHWNGGVFLFDDQGHEFLEAWHKKCLFVFNSPDWRTRDQGALIATVWEFGLQDHPTLSKVWNFIVDAQKEVNNELMIFDAATQTFSDGKNEQGYTPHFIHVYHDFGKTDWYLWQWIEQLGARHGFKPYSHFKHQDAGTSNA